MEKYWIFKSTAFFTNSVPAGKKSVSNGDEMGKLLIRSGQVTETFTKGICTVIHYASFS